MIVRLLGVLDLLNSRLGFEAGNLDQRWAFMIMVVHHSSQTKNVKPRKFTEVAKKTLAFFATFAVKKLIA